MLEGIEEPEEIAQLVSKEREVVGPVTLTTWVLAIIATLIGGFISSWLWLLALLVPVILNALIVNLSYRRLCRKTGLDPSVIHHYWKASQHADLHDK